MSLKSNLGGLNRIMLIVEFAKLMVRWSDRRHDRNLLMSSLSFAKYGWFPPLSVQNSLRNVLAISLASALSADATLPSNVGLLDAMIAVLAMSYSFSI